MGAYQDRTQRLHRLETRMHTSMIMIRLWALIGIASVFVFLVIAMAVVSAGGEQATALGLIIIGSATTCLCFAMVHAWDRSYMAASREYDHLMRIT